MKKIQNILIIDDSEDDRELYRRYLMSDKRFDWTISEAENAEDGLKAFQSQDDPLVLLDYSLPGRSGLELLNDLKGRNLYTPAVLLTGQGNEAIAAECMKHGAQDYLAKNDITPEALQKTLGHALDRIGMMRKIDEQREALSVFAQLLAHDLKATIRHILSLTDMIATAVENREYEDLKTYQELVQRSGLQLQELIDTLSEYNRLDGAAVSFDAVSMETVMDDVLSQLSEAIDERKAQVTHDTLPAVLGNAPQLAQLLQNLVANGMKFCKAPVPTIRVSANELDTAWQITVRDNGVGIPGKYLESIFEPFRRLHGREQYAGTGLGLATCQKIVARHRGRIWCESIVGEGTTFHFTIPKIARRDGQASGAG